MTTLFISDLHLDPAQPGITQQFLQFVARAEGRTEALYILGDLFEAWLGDDDPEPEYRRVVAALRKLRDSGTRIGFMHGNRDFLVGERFSSESGCELLDEHTLIDVHGSRVLLMHGDLLCTDDVEYQAFRRMVRDPAWQQHLVSYLASGQAAILIRFHQHSGLSVGTVNTIHNWSVRSRVGSYVLRDPAVVKSHRIRAR